MNSDLENLGVNPSVNPLFRDVVEARLSRRTLLQGGLVAAAVTLLARRTPAAAASPLGFTGIPVSTADTVRVPEGYTVEVLYAWGDPVSDGPAFRSDASNTAAEQERQAGMHHDGLHYFPLPAGAAPSRATRSARPTGSGWTGEACCGSRPTCRRAPSTTATMRGSATT